MYNTTYNTTIASFLAQYLLYVPKQGTSYMESPTPTERLLGDATIDDDVQTRYSAVRVNLH